jgi:hypothetical protein
LCENINREDIIIFSVKEEIAMEISNVLSLSTACIDVSTANILNESAFHDCEICDGLVAYAKGLYGWIVHVPTSYKSNHIPDDLNTCLKYAMSKNCEWIMFDRDVEYDEKDGLPKYDW